MSDSTKWALERMESANRIYEPNEKTWRRQLTNLIVWAIECILVLHLASSLYGL
jgi:hypothetical protein